VLVVVVKVRKTAKKNLRCDILGMGDSLEVISRAVIEKLQTKRSRVGREREVYTLLCWETCARYEKRISYS
jgi:hypothetical protein